MFRDEQEIEEKLTLLDDLQSTCTNCGLCLEGCATFQLTGWEHESPRGRLHLAGQFLHGRIALQSSALTTFDRCLGCQACESLCPHQVPYRQVRQCVQELRGKLQPLASSSAMDYSQYKRWITLAQRMGHFLWKRYGGKWLTLPQLDGCRGWSFSQKSPPPLKEQPVLAICCMQDMYQHEVIEQTFAFFKRLGYAVAIDQKQPCCGALFERLVHGGEEAVVYAKQQQRAQSLQRQTLHAFLKWLPPSTYFLAKGCEGFIAKHTEQAGDLYVWIEALLEQQNISLYFSKPREVYYQPYCSAKKGQNDPIWRLLHGIKGLTVRNFAQSDSCCGGYCGETLLHPEHAQALADQKLAVLPEQATVIITSPDCWGLFKKHAPSLTLLYPIQLLGQALMKQIG